MRAGLHLDHRVVRIESRKRLGVGGLDRLAHCLEQVLGRRGEQGSASVPSKDDCFARRTRCQGG